MKALIEQLRRMALSSLPRMYDPAARLCAFRIRKSENGIIREGISRRYTAIALIGLAAEDVDAGPNCFAGESCLDVCGRLLAQTSTWTNLGDTALTLWAARLLNHPKATDALSQIRRLDPLATTHPTVELAWTLMALSACGTAPLEPELAQGVCDRLMACFNRRTGMFSHMPAGSQVSWPRGHIVCFADLVYPIQALSSYGTLVGGHDAIAAGKQTARTICDLQGGRGQWWWHYDYRTGNIVEPYPVYSVHQDAMAPMALFASQEACGEDFSDGVARGLDWLAKPEEIGFSLIDEKADVIWRKVARHEPGKLARGMQAAASALHPALRVPLVDTIFRPNWVDYESRPYHMGWILHAFTSERTKRFLKQAGEGEAHGREKRALAGTAPI